MRETIIYELKSIYRDPMRIRAFQFGGGKDSVCIMGATRGNEIQPLYICSRLVRALREEERKGHFAPDQSVTVIPTVNSYSMNVEKRFWPTDNTDINRMFPGYLQGETTQRIAASVFERISRFEYGIQLASYYMPGYFTPHVRIMKTGYERLIWPVVRSALCDAPQPNPMTPPHSITNWQIWDTTAFFRSIPVRQIKSMKAAPTSDVDAAVEFSAGHGNSLEEQKGNSDAENCLRYECSLRVSTQRRGCSDVFVSPNQEVHRGDVIASVLDPYTGEELECISARRPACSLHITDR
jgi:hypothetical protein